MSDLANVLIVGGGTAGAATAVALARRGIEDVHILEPNAAAGVFVGESIPPETGTLLRDLGVWDAFVGQGHEPCLGSCSVWGSDTMGFNDFVLNPHGSGWHLDRRRFDELLIESARSHGTKVINARATDCAQVSDGTFIVNYVDADGTSASIRSRFMVDASGANAVAALALGAKRRTSDRLMFVYGFFRTDPTRQNNRLTLLEAVPNGWWYCAALPDQRLAVALATDSATLRAHHLADDDQWTQQLLSTRHLAPRLVSAERVGPLVVRNAPSFILNRVAGQGWLAVGDAASAHDPIASQGIYKALEDAFAASDALCDGLEERARLTFSNLVSDRFEEYLANRDYLYGLEQRWPTEMFWKRRHEAATHSSSVRW